MAFANSETAPAAEYDRSVAVMHLDSSGFVRALSLKGEAFTGQGQYARTVEVPVDQVTPIGSKFEDVLL
jgi:hypothetical protein